MFVLGQLVTNNRAEEWGVGEIVEDSNDYLTVYFQDINDNVEFSKKNHPLSIVSDQHDNNRQSALPKQQPFNKTGSSKLSDRVERDQNNATKAQKFALEELRKNAGYQETVDITIGPSSSYIESRNIQQKLIESLMAISKIPFHLMIEAEVDTVDSYGRENKTTKILYANEFSSYNAILGTEGNRVNVLAWTHPAIQLGRTRDLKEEVDIRSHGYTLTAITPFARAKFSQVLPEISGLYEPGGSVGRTGRSKTAEGLKAVKLDMTRDQVDAFLSKMNGMMLVSGAPGSGKTTVAMQRIRFLFDQQDDLRDDLGGIKYNHELTKIFLGNTNLIEYSKSLLKNELNIPTDIVELVEDFISKYLSDIWAYKHNAKLRRKKISTYEERGRQAFYGLCSVQDLKDCWFNFEIQIAERIKQSKNATWLNLASSKRAKQILQKLASFLSVISTKQPASSILSSPISMDAVYKSIGKEYEEARAILKEEEQIEKFDQQFQQWLFWVYDPFDAVESYFRDALYQGSIRIKNGIGLRIREDEIIDAIKTEWHDRVYGKEEQAWLAFLLRFSLPTETDNMQRFRNIPNPLSVAETTSGERWTHVMIDEAQDLSVAEAALLGSFVHPDGAFTVSADFHQVVSPVWGMETPEAFRIGSSLRDKGSYQSFPFAKNMRQTKQIGLFLRSFYQNIFGEIAPFSENVVVEGAKPLLLIGRSSSFAERIKQRLNVHKRNQDIQSIALIQVNEDEEGLMQYREQLSKLGVDMVPIWKAKAKNRDQLVTTSVERIKGLEYDVCFVVGMDTIESSTLKHSKNRAYVALSRPALQLTIFCEEVPRSLQRIDQSLMDIYHI
jgi:superfamily I DNA/RNA helicase